MGSMSLPKQGDPNAPAIVYMMSNSVNKKVYVGVTQTSLHERFNKHRKSVQRRSGRPLYVDMKKFGDSAFKIEPLAHVPNLSEGHKMEIIWVFLLNAKTPNGYNLTDGGRGFTRVMVLSPDQIEKRRRAANIRWSKPGSRKKASDQNKVRQAEPKVKKLIGERTKAQWRDPEYQKRVSNKIRVGWAKRLKTFKKTRKGTL